MLGANLQNLLSARKDISITPSTKLKQLQWDKLPQQQAEKTVFKEPSKEDEWVKKLQLDGVWMEMEEDFKAKQLVINLMAKQKRAELKSVLDPQTKKRVGEWPGVDPGMRCLLTRYRRDPHPDCQEAPARGDRAQDSRLRPGGLHTGFPQRTQTRSSEPGAGKWS